ncbi:hypothetical protein L5M43_22895 [Shewanella sp. SW36]|uniref:hypothetical protein n=1 Tax=Shewanella sp. SW36 TaxID=2912818 RepID=UPI0021DA23EA|nr:hypothetical protein [Shewanella sp. SW36]MCU7978051.1 hypothetical protein [Shewanella sp. SW36]
MELEENSREEASAILRVIQCNTFDQDDIRVFLERQMTLLPTLEDVPERLHSMLFQLGKIEPTWENCLAFIEGNVFEADSLIEYFDREVIRAAILQYPIPSNDDSLPLRRFIFEAISIPDVVYREYVRALPRTFSYQPKGLEPTKLRILIDEKKIAFTKEMLDLLADKGDLQVLFVAANIETYLAKPDRFALDDDFLEELLRTQIDIVAKLGIVKLMDLELLVDLPKRSALIGPIIVKTDADIPSLNRNIVQSLMRYSSPIATQISLLNKYHTLMKNDDVRHVLANLPKPFSEIKTGYNSPRLKSTPENLELVKWLDSRDIISTWSENFITNDIKVNLYRR